VQYTCLKHYILFGVKMATVAKSLIDAAKQKAGRAAVDQFVKVCPCCFYAWCLFHRQ